MIIDDRELAAFTAAFIEALYFTDTGDREQPSSDAELSPDALADIEADCRSFWRRFGCYALADENGPRNPCEQAGHDFWLTRNGHGAGFWDGDWPQPYADMLDKGARLYGELDVFEGDDGLLYVA